jgi:two-component system sensor histidine kinase UhpB
VKRGPGSVESRLGKEHEEALRDYLGGSGERALKRAYELGRQALFDGLGVLEMARLHHGALLRLSPVAASEWARTIKRAGRLFVESLTPFEMTHRGFQEANTALTASEEQYRELFENANDMVFTADLEGNLTSLNHAGERLSGYPRTEALSLNIAAVISPEYAATARRAGEGEHGHDGTRHVVDMITRDGRRVPVEISTRLIRRHGQPTGLQGIARDITERKQAEEALRRVNERLEEGIKRIAHALHDDAGQLLAAVHLALQEIAIELPPEQRSRLERISVPLDEATEQLRRLSHELRPVILDDFGLVPAFEFLAEGVAKRTGLVIRLEGSLRERLAPVVETTLYRIVQEALTNVGRHACATHVTIQIRKNGRSVECTVRDDGIGFDEAALWAQRGRPSLGLIGIRERATALGGTFSITSGPGLGTTLTLAIPVEG